MCGKERRWNELLSLPVDTFLAFRSVEKVSRWYAQNRVSAVEVKTHLTRVSTSVVEGMEVRERARVFGLRACAGRIPGIWSNYATQQNVSHSFLFQPMLCMLGQLGSPASPEGGVSRAEDGGRARTVKREAWGRLASLLDSSRGRVCLQRAEDTVPCPPYQQRGESVASGAYTIGGGRGVMVHGQGSRIASPHGDWGEIGLFKAPAESMSPSSLSRLCRARRLLSKRLDASCNGPYCCPAWSQSRGADSGRQAKVGS
ncbi:hypothetical protein PMIN01_01668 [Paraphaeosphaeria minitans]|uniref:Uncharacterized protein n=1 Tax=Paraphaeosphaeria minitans TaxID=565426 RepID=A0A9P6GP81_9PLEO|nr:hypothetical protein PMIN01_01668 [Paraphaeosphaeria minitans]